MTTPLRVAIVGFGGAGSILHGPLIAATDGMEVAAVVTSNPQRAAQAKRAHPSARVVATVDELWKRTDHLDLVVVATPNRHHAPIAEAAMRSGLAVVVDKPMATETVDAERLLVVSNETGALLTVFHNRRWDNDFRTVRRVVNDERCGQTLRFESRYERFRPTARTGAWREGADPRDGGGLLFDLGSHIIDQALQLFGEPAAVYCEAEHRRAGVEVDDDTFVSLTFGNGVIAHLWMSAVTVPNAPRMRVVGTGGVFEKFGMDPQEEALKAGRSPGDPGWGEESSDHWGVLTLGTDDDNAASERIRSERGAYDHFYAAMRDAMQGASPVPVEPEGAVATLRVIEAARRSARDRTVVTGRTSAEACS